MLRLEKGPFKEAKSKFNSFYQLISNLFSV